MKIEDYTKELRDELNKRNQHNASIKEIEISTTAMLDEIHLNKQALMYHWLLSV